VAGSASASRPGNDAALLLLRIGFAALLIGFHGWARANRATGFLFHGTPWTFVDVVGRLGFPFPAFFAVTSVASESIGALLLIPGYFTRVAAFLTVVNFSVALYNEMHKGDPWELPALYLLMAVVILIAGPGRWSLDARLRGRT
jgi:putative oxidoreductase